MKVENETVFHLEVVSTDTIETVKYQIQKQSGQTFENPKLLYGAKELEDSYTLEDYGIEGSALLQVVRRNSP